MRKIFCDRCGAECAHSVTRVGIVIEHTANQGQHAGEDEYRPAELCYACGQGAIEYVYKDPEKFHTVYQKESIPEDLPMMRTQVAEERYPR